MRFEQPALEATLADYLEEVDHVGSRIVKLDKAIDEAIRQAPPEIRAVIEALQALRGVAQTTAASIVAEVGSLSRFPSPRELMGYSGLVPSEHSSGNRVQRGGITKTGNGHLRRVIGEAAWAYQHRPNVIGFLAQRQKNLAISEESKKIAWKAQQRLHKRYKALSARGKNKNQIVTAVGRELLGFIWAIGVETEKQHKLAVGGINETRMFYWTAEPMTAQGPRKGEPSSASMRYGLRPQPARLVRGSSRRIMTMRFRPANIRVINRRVCSWAVIGPAVQNQTRSKPTSGNVFPLRRPSTGPECQNGARSQGFASPRQNAARP